MKNVQNGVSLRKIVKKYKISVKFVSKIKKGSNLHITSNKAGRQKIVAKQNHLLLLLQQG